MMSAEENCATLVEAPTENELNQAITGNMAHLMTVVKAAKRFKKLIYRKRPQFMEGLFGRESRLSAAPTSMRAKSVDVSDRRAVETAITTEGVHRSMDEELIKAPSISRLAVESPSSLDSTAGAVESPSLSYSSQTPSQSDDQIERPHLSNKASTFPLEERGKGHAHDPLEDQVYLNIGAGGDLGGVDELGGPLVCESPGGVDEDIYEAAYQLEINRILGDSGGADLVLNRRVEHIEGLRRHPNVLKSSVNHAVDFAGTSASRVHAKARNSGLASLVRETRTRTRESVNQRIDERAARKAEEAAASMLSTPSLKVSEPDCASPVPTRPGPGPISGVNTPPSRAHTPNSERRLRDAARLQAGQVLKGVANRLSEKAGRLEAKSVQQYEGT